MENGARPAAGAHWIAATPPNFRARVVQKIVQNMSQVPMCYQVDKLRLHDVASRYEDTVFSQSGNAQDYLRTISKKMLSLQHNRQPAVPAASDLGQQQAQMGRHQMLPINAALVNSSGAMMPQTASAIQFSPQLQNMRNRVNQAQPVQPRPAAPVVQLRPCHPTVVNQTKTLCPARQDSIQKPQHELNRMNPQGLRVEQRQSYQTHNGANVALMQTSQCGGQNNQHFRNPHPEGVVDWREDMFKKITSLKDAHFSEILEFGRLLESYVLQIKANGQLESLPKEQAALYRYTQPTMERIRKVLSFLRFQKTNIPEVVKDKLDMFQTAIRDLLDSYKRIKDRNAAKNAQLQSQNFREPPQVVNIGGATDNSQQNHHEQHAAEALSSLTQQENHSDDLAGEAEDDTVRGEVESPVAVNLPGDAAAFTGRICSEKEQQRHPADDAIPQLTQNVEPAGTSPAHQQTQSAHSVHVVEAEDDSVQAEAETPVSMEALIKRGVDAARSLSPTGLRSLASDMGVNLKRAFPHRTPDTTDDSICPRFDDVSSGKSCYKRQKVHYGTLADEIKATHEMLIQTEIRISEEGTGGVDGTVIDLCYNAVSLAANFRAAICASELSTKLFVPTDYPRSSPVVLVSDGEWRKGVPGVVDMAFRRSLVLLPEPRSIEEMAKAWDSVVRRCVERFAHRLSGGPSSRRHGGWECCIPV